jgi:hypothetical protein
MISSVQPNLRGARPLFGLEYTVFGYTMDTPNIRIFAINTATR